MWELTLSRDNLLRALRRVEANKGAPGADGMSTAELRPWLREHWAGVREALDAGTYRPLAVRRVVIPMPGGGERLLGVSSVLDRMIQQAMAQVHAVFRPVLLGVQFWVPSRQVRPSGGAGRAAMR
ncbi:hypothetical protein Acor_11670 [Acrocarpospora corrugata]|uniref:Reverse transcriptase domain-containing protein n=1 Tax=Acrocarpospora corrugata TaxID=35763 RepID=A0A5M3VRI4_9ACTN|nr:hypothetical protein Acor_11670 [Acrocarpospora corrugata]